MIHVMDSVPYRTPPRRTRTGPARSLGLATVSAVAGRLSRAPARTAVPLDLRSSRACAEFKALFNSAFRDVEEDTL